MPMSTLEKILLRLTLFTTLGTVAFFLLVIGYGILRGLRIPVDWVTWTIGIVIMAANVLLCLSVILPGKLGEMRGSGNLLGLVCFLVAVYSASQWTTRQWYVRIKTSTISLLVKGIEEYLFVR